jgi:hypothetical protein
VPSTKSPEPPKFSSGSRSDSWRETKSARWKSPRKSQRALCFRSPRRSPGPFDFPPEIKRSTMAWLGMRLASWSAEASRNGLTMPENQRQQSIFRGCKRSTGRKTGRKAAFLVFRSTEGGPKLSPAPIAKIPVAGVDHQAHPAKGRIGNLPCIRMANFTSAGQQPAQRHGDGFDFNLNGAERDRLSMSRVRDRPTILCDGSCSRRGSRRTARRWAVCT